MKRSLKKVLLIILGVIAVVTALSAWLESRRVGEVQQALADTRRALREQGFKTELVDFKVTTDAATRARTAALTVLDNSLQLDSHGNSLDLMPRVSDDTATVIWKQDALNLGSGTLQWSELHAVLATNREALDAACGAALSGPIRFELDGSRSDGLIHAAKLKRLAVALGNRTLLELHEGHPDAAGTNLLAATRLVTACEAEPVPLCQMFRSFSATIAFAATWQALQNDHWSEEKLAVLQEQWESADFFARLPETAAFDRASAADVCVLESQQPPFAGFAFSRFAAEAVQTPLQACSEIQSGIDLMRYRGREALTDEKNLLSLFRDRELALRQAIQSPTWKQMRARPGVTNVLPFKSAYAAMTYFPKSLQRTETLVAALAADAEARRRIVIAAIALERYRGKHGVYPGTLAPLAPEFLTTVPVDFMDGQPLRYRLTDDGHFVLYSVGLDCVDDGGKLSLPDAPRMPKDEAGVFSAPTNVDIVWPRPDHAGTRKPTEP